MLTRNSVPSGMSSGRSGCLVRVDRPRYGSVHAHQLRPSVSRSGSTARMSWPIASCAAMPVSRVAAWLNTTIRPA